MARKRLSDSAVLKQFKKHFEEADEIWGPRHADFLRFKRFVAVENGMWTQEEKDRMGEPALQTNRLLAYVNQVVNTAMQQDIGCIVEPRSVGATLDLALVRQAQIMALWNLGKGPFAAAYALREQVWGSYGVIYKTIEFADKKGFNKVLRWKALEDPTQFRCDPSASGPGLSDMRYCMIEKSMTKSGFSKEYGEIESMDRDARDLFENGNRLRLHEYWFIKDEGYEIFAARDGKTYRSDELEAWDIKERGPMPKKLKTMGGMDATRRVEDGYVEQAIIGNDRVLKRVIWPGSRIPHKVIEGRIIAIDGQKSYQAMTTHAMSPQRKYNFIDSQKAIMFSKGPQELVFVPAESSTEAILQQLNDVARNGSTNVSVVKYKSLTADGDVIPPPTFKAQIMGDPVLTQEGAIAIQDIEACFGMSPQNWIRPAPDASGVSMQRREEQGQTSNFDFPKHWMDALEEAFRDDMEIIPKLGISMQLKLAGSDQKERVIWLNGGGETLRPGVENVELDEDEEYALILRVSPSEKTQKELAFDQIMQMMKINPALAVAIPDLAIRAGTASTYTEAMAKRAERMVPKNILSDMPDPQIQAMAAQLQQAQGLIAQQQEQLKIASGKMAELTAQVKAERQAAGDTAAAKAMQANLDRMQVMFDQRKFEVESLLDKMKLMLEERKIQLEEKRLDKEVANDLLGGGAPNEPGSDDIPPPPPAESE